MSYILGIVGHEGAKFTRLTEHQARIAICGEILRTHATRVVSGACHLGGIDVWAIQEAVALSIDTEEFPPANRRWEGGYKERNMQIAIAADEVICIVVKELPASYHGMRFSSCYHCKSASHVKSGGCWTVKYARSLGRVVKTIEI